MKGLSFDDKDGDAPVYRYGEVQYFFEHKPESSDQTSYLFAVCSWMVEESNPGFQGSCKRFDLTVINDTFHPPSKFSILPVHCIHSPLTTSPYISGKKLYATSMKKITV